MVLDQSQHWTLRNPISLNWKEQRELAIQRSTISGHVWCPFGHWFERNTEEPDVHHIVKKRHWMNPSYSHILPNLVPLCRQHHRTGILPWHNERPHFLMRVFASVTGSEFTLHSRHRDQYMSWDRTKMAVLERDGFQCQRCGAGRRYIDEPLYRDGLSSYIRYCGSSIRPYHFANPNDRPTIAHLTHEMVTLCFDCYWRQGGNEAPNGWRKRPYEDWRSQFEEI